MDPMGIAIGGGLVIAGWLMGRVGRKRGKSSDSTPALLCSCEHGYGVHQSGGTCHGDVKRPKYNIVGSWVGNEYAACPCQSYDGPEPLPRVWTDPN